MQQNRQGGLLFHIPNSIQNFGANQTQRFTRLHSYASKSHERPSSSSISVTRRDLCIPSPSSGLSAKMAAGRIPHVTLKGPNVVKEVVVGISLGLLAGSFWKMHHWNEQKKYKSFYDLEAKGEISLVAEE